MPGLFNICSFLLLVVLFLHGAPVAGHAKESVIRAKLTRAPSVPPPVTRTTPARVVVHF